MTSQDIPEALRLLELAAEKNHAESLYTLGVLYLRGREVPRDLERAAGYAAAAARAGHAKGADLRSRIERVRQQGGAGQGRQRPRPVIE